VRRAESRRRRGPTGRVLTSSPECRVWFPSLAHDRRCVITWQSIRTPHTRSVNCRCAVWSTARRSHTLQMRRRPVGCLPGKVTLAARPWALTRHFLCGNCLNKLLYCQAPTFPRTGSVTDGLARNRVITQYTAFPWAVFADY
jgi:hypothetical protein